MVGYAYDLRVFLRKRSGDVFDIHLTVSGMPENVEAAAARLGLKFVQIELSRGVNRYQPMLTGTIRGSLDDAAAALRAWDRKLRAANIWVRRRKIEAAPWNAGVPADDGVVQAPGRYFEHHVKVLLAPSDLSELSLVAAGCGAHTSRNARRTRDDGMEERFVTLRCFGVGLPTASAHLDRLIAALDAAGLQRLETESEYVMVDDNLGHDADWLPDAQLRAERAADFPRSYLPVARAAGVRQERVFEPALTHFRNAFTAGEPVFDDPELGANWRLRQRLALDLVLTAVANSEYADYLVLRGGMTMRRLCGNEAEEPRDIDLVVTGGASHEVLGGIISAVRRLDDPAMRFADAVSTDEIWTYERAEGRRVVFTWHAAGLPPGTVQVDVVFNEPLPRACERYPITGTAHTIASVGAELALGWKIMWLHSDWYPQIKDLYDAVILAERTTIDPALVAELLQDDHGPNVAFEPAMVLDWTFRDDANAIRWSPVEIDDLKLRLYEALTRSW